MPNFEQAGVAYRTNIQFQAQLQSHTVRGHSEPQEFPLL